MTYRTVHMVRHAMPEDRLAVARVGESGGDQLLTFAYRAWRIHPALVHEMGDLSSHIAEAAVYDLDLLREGAPPVFTCWFELMAPESAPRDRLMTYRITEYGWELALRSDLVDPAVVRELNEHVMPTVCGILVPVNAGGGAPVALHR